MKTWKQWNKAVATTFIAAALSVVAFNVILDPFSVIGTGDWMRQGYNVNERYRKVEHLRKHIGKHDSFIIGSSTMGLFPTDVADQLTPGRSWYNLSFLAGTPPEALRALKYLKSQGQPIKEVMFGIDIFAFRKLEKSRDQWKREHPLVTGEAMGKWWQAALFASSFQEGIERITHNMHEHPRLFFDTEGTGRYYLRRWDREIERDEKAFIQAQIYERTKDRDKPIPKSGFVMVKERFEELKELKDWLDTNGVKSHIWINPMHWRTLSTIEDASLVAFRRQIRDAIGDVKDYSVRDDICGDDRKFYEWKHFRPSTAASMMREILPVQNSVAIHQLADSPAGNRDRVLASTATQDRADR